MTKHKLLLTAFLALSAAAAPAIAFVPAALAAASAPAAAASAPAEAAAELEEGLDQNMKAEKINFARQAANESTLSPYVTTPLLSPYQVLAGSVIPGTLVTGMNSDLPGTVVGQVAMNVYDSAKGKYLLIPQGTRIIGIYDTRTAYAQTRGHVIWQRLVFPNGKSLILPNLPGADQEGYTGLKDKVRSHYARVIWSALIGAAITGGVAAATDTDDDGSFRAEAGAQASSNISSATNSIVQKNLNIAPTVIIRPGYKFNIVVDKDLLLEPYAED